MCGSNRSDRESAKGVSFSDEYTLFHTGLPNFKLLKAVFDHVAKGLSSDGASKLSQFQEFMCVMLKAQNELTK